MLDKIDVSLDDVKQVCKKPVIQLIVIKKDNLSVF